MAPKKRKTTPQAAPKEPEEYIKHLTNEELHQLDRKARQIVADFFKQLFRNR